MCPCLFQYDVARLSVICVDYVVFSIISVICEGCKYFFRRERLIFVIISQSLHQLKFYLSFPTPQS